MSVERTQVMQFEIQTSASGNGLRMTAEQMKELEARIDALNSKAGKSPADLLQLGHMKNALFFAQQAGVTEEAKALGGKIGEHAGEEAGEKLIHHLKRHLANMGGQLAGVGGLGGLFAAGGMAGIGAGAGLALIEKAFEAIIEKVGELKEEFTATGEVVEKMKVAQVFSEENVHRIHEVSEGMATAKHGTTEWLKVLGELTKAGADPKTFGEMAQHVKELAHLMGGDLAGATRIATQELEGEFGALKDLGIIADATWTQEETLAFVTQQVALRFAELGNAAVSSAPQVVELKKAAKEVADGMDGMKASAEDAAEAMAKLLALSEADKGDKLKQINAEEQRDVQEVETALAEGRIKTRQQADVKIQQIQKEAAAKRIAAEKEDFERQKKAQVDAFEDANSGMGMRAGAIADQKRNVENANERARLQKMIADAEARNGGGRALSPEEMTKKNEYDAFIAKHGNTYGMSAQDAAVGKLYSDRYAKYGDTVENSVQAAQARNAIAEIDKELPANRRNQAAEQQKLNDLRKAFSEMDEADTKRMLKAQEAIKELERKYGVAKTLTETEAATKDSATQQKTAQAEEQRRKQLESEAKNYEKRRQDAREHGLPDPEKPDDLKGRSYQYDMHNERFQWLNSAGNELKEGAAALKDFVDAAIELKRVAITGASRMRNDGGRVG